MQYEFWGGGGGGGSGFEVAPPFLLSSHYIYFEHSLCNLHRVQIHICQKTSHDSKTGWAAIRCVICPRFGGPYLHPRFALTAWRTLHALLILNGPAICNANWGDSHESIRSKKLSS